MGEDLAHELRPILGPDPLNGTHLDFRPLCVHEDTVSLASGPGWVLTRKCEEYYVGLEGLINEDLELVRLGSGRLLQWVAIPPSGVG